MSHNRVFESDFPRPPFYIFFVIVVVVNVGCLRVPQSQFFAPQKKNKTLPLGVDKNKGNKKQERYIT